MVLLYLCLAVGCVFWQPDIVLGDSKQADSVLNLFNIDLNNYDDLNTLNHSTSSETSSLLSRGVDNQGQNILLNVVDGLLNVMGYIILLFNIVFSPIRIMVAGAFPFEIMYILGIPMVVLFILGVVRFVRGY